MIDENKLIEEMAQMYAHSIVHYGVDISEEYKTATSMNLALDRAYLKGVEEGIRGHGFKDGYEAAVRIVTEAFNKYYDEIDEYDENVNKLHSYVFKALYR